MTSTAGFTLFELMIVMLIVGILAAIGVPSYQYVTASNRIASEVNGLLGDMQYARAEAIKEGLPVTVCVSTDGATCAAGNTNWNNGWIVFADSNGNHSVDSGEPVLRQQAAFTPDTFVANDNFSWATFNREGFAATGTTSVVTVTLHAPNNVADWTRCLTITPVGMLSVQRAGAIAPGSTVSTCS
ncbi:MAG TPA: GspH/FimT family pseudopilin [Steroidobacteraceae bacterium]|nr:GspH/FimT family pseudopilin [Steroidobacteraceae bacterium]